MDHRGMMSASSVTERVIGMLSYAHDSILGPMNVELEEDTQEDLEAEVMVEDIRNYIFSNNYI